MVKAYSYIRFSTPEQKKGDSYERQSAKSRKYCEERNYELVEEFLDDGVSGFRGEHRKKGRLGAFLRLVAQGKIEPGSILLVENLDRFSREVAIESFLSLQNLLMKGIDVVILESNRHLTGKNQNDFDYIQTLLEFSRSHSESLRKQETCGASWRKKKENAIDRVITGRVPYWLEVIGDGKKTKKEIQIIPERAKVIRKIFELAASGYGGMAITRTLNKQKTAVFGKSKAWHVSYVKKILKNEAVYGRYIPYTRAKGVKRQLDGEPTENYYPEIISKDKFLAVRTHCQDRVNKGGRDKATGENLFSGLLECGTCGGPVAYANKGNGLVYLVCLSAKNGSDCPYLSVPYKEFEARILAKVPNMFGYQDEEPIVDNQLADGIRAKMFEIGEKIRNLEKAIQIGGDLENLVGIMKGLQKERTETEVELDRELGMNHRQKMEKEITQELKKSIMHILEGDFLRIMEGQGDNRFKLKMHLSQVIKKIVLVNAFSEPSKIRVWYPRIILRNGKEIHALRDPETQVNFDGYIDHNNLDEDLNEKEEPFEASK
jgi:DNA invertase Pin-like site-specific DNA recombinase